MRILHLWVGLFIIILFIQYDIGTVEAGGRAGGIFGVVDGAVASALAVDRDLIAFDEVVLSVLRAIADYYFKAVLGLADIIVGIFFFGIHSVVVLGLLLYGEGHFQIVLFVAFGVSVEFLAVDILAFRHVFLAGEERIDGAVEEIDYGSKSYGA